MSIDPHPPFLHPRKDRFLARARRLTALFLSVAQASWFFGFLEEIRRGVELGLPFSLLGLAGIFLIASRVRLTADIILGLQDRRAGIGFAPAPRILLNSALLGLALPGGLLGLGLVFASDEVMLYYILFALVLAEAVHRLLGMSTLSRGHIRADILRPLLDGSPEQALTALQNTRIDDSDQLEYSVLAIAGVAIRRTRPAVLDELIIHLEKLRPPGFTAAGEVFERMLAVVRADHARFLSAASAAPAEATALRLLPTGHPRRLPFGLFVATAALDDGDHESALKALSLLHTRDVSDVAGRALVDWFLLTTATSLHRADLAESCRRALATFDLRRIAAAITLDDTPGSDDPYSRWLQKAKIAMEAGIAALAPNGGPEPMDSQSGQDGR